MRAADLIVGKAGASFITEAFMVEKPFIATTFIAGHYTDDPIIHWLHKSI